MKIIELLIMMIKTRLNNFMVDINRKETLVDSSGSPYCVRYIIWGRKDAVKHGYRGKGLYIQKRIKSDTLADLYDHSWRWGRLIIKGQFNEKARNKSSAITHSRKIKSLNLITLHSSRFSHSVELIDNKPVWMIFWHGRSRNQWGYWVDNKKVHWREHFSNITKSAT